MKFLRDPHTIWYSTAAAEQQFPAAESGEMLAESDPYYLNKMRILFLCLVYYLDSIMNLKTRKKKKILALKYVMYVFCQPGTQVQPRRGQYGVCWPFWRCVSTIQYSHFWSRTKELLLCMVVCGGFVDRAQIVQAVVGRGALLHFGGALLQRSW